MDSVAMRFWVFVVVSLIAFVAILRFVTRHRAQPLRLGPVIGVAAIVVVGGMVFAKYGHNAGLPWWIYYPVPALATLLLPPVAFKFSRRELAWYWCWRFYRRPRSTRCFRSCWGGMSTCRFSPLPTGATC